MPIDGLPDRRSIDLTGVKDVAPVTTQPTAKSQTTALPATKEAPVNRQTTVKDLSENKVGLLTKLTVLIKQIDAWPYKTTVNRETGELKPTLSNPATSSLGRFGFNVMSVAKDALFLAPRVVAGTIGGLVGLGMMGGGLVASLFSKESKDLSNDLKTKLLYNGMATTSFSVITGGLSPFVRLVGSIVNLAQPLTNVDATIVGLNKIVAPCIKRASELSYDTALSFSAVKVENPSQMEFNSDDFIDELNADIEESERSSTEPQMDFSQRLRQDTLLGGAREAKEVDESEMSPEELKDKRRRELQFGDSVKKIIGLAPSIAGQFTVTAAQGSDGHVKLKIKTPLDG